MNENTSSNQEQQEGPRPRGGGAFGGMVVGGAIGLAIAGPLGIFIGGVLGALAGNKIEEEELARRQEEKRAIEAERRLGRRY